MAYEARAGFAPSLRRLAVRTALAVEQEVRAHPRLYAAFYRGINRSDLARGVVGAVKARARSRSWQQGALTQVHDAPLVAAERRRSVALQLGLASAAEPPPVEARG